MTSEAKPARVLYKNLDTSFVNLWALLRYLSQRSFVGRVQVKLENYEAEVFLNGSDTPLVHEVDREAGTDVVEEAALHRLVLRVRESPGSISVYEGADEASPTQIESLSDAPVAVAAATPEPMRSSSAKEGAEVRPESKLSSRPFAAADEWQETVKLSGELIAAVERAAVGMGADFSALFRESRVALADDYTFLDPIANRFRYENTSAMINGDSAPIGYVAGLSEALRRVVDRFATGEKERRARERVALELARVARKNSEGLTRSGFQEQLDRIAGTKVI